MSGTGGGRLGRAAAGNWPVLYFVALALAVWGPALFANGYVLLGDMVFTPAMHPPVSLAGPQYGTLDVAVVYNLAWLVSRLVGAVLLQKAVLFLIAFLPGYLMYRNVPATRLTSRIFAGTLYLVNPFVYTRMVMGQWGFLLGYAMLPVVFASTVKTVRGPTPRRAALTALVLAGTAVLSLHAGALAMLVFLITGAFTLARGLDRKRSMVAGAAVVVLFVLLSAFWLLPGLTSGSRASAIGRADLKAFETRSTSKAGTAVSLLGLYGYWKTQVDELMPRRHVPLWFLSGFLLVLLCAYGLFRYWGEPGRGPVIGALALLGVVGFFLALGARAPGTGPLFRALFDNVAPFRIFREPQKFAALIVLAYASVGASGLDGLLSRARRREPATPASPGSSKRNGKGLATVVVLILIVLLYTFRMFGGLWGEARAVSYPRSWSEAQSVLSSDPGDWSVMYLPPFWYMRFGFTASDTTITNPMPWFFTARSVPLGAIEVGGIKLDMKPVDEYVQAALTSARDNGNLGAMLAPLAVKYVLIPLNEASALFPYLERQRDMEVVRRWDDLVLLENKVRVNRLVLVRRRGSYADWASAGDRARGGVLLGSYLTKGPATVLPESIGRPVPHTVSAGGAVRATLPPAEPTGGQEVLLFGEPYSGRWRASGPGSMALEQLGVVTAFPLEEGGGRRVTIAYRDASIPAGYAVSAAGLLLCLVLLVVRRRGGAERRTGR